MAHNLKLGAELTAEGERRLLAVQEVRAQVSLARGMAADRADNSVEALGFYIQALEADQQMREASRHIQNFAQGAPGATIRERANWAAAQKEQWEKIFSDLTAYINANLLVVYYDFSSLADQFNARNNTVEIAVSPGVKFLPDRTALAVWKTVIDTWERVKALEENRSWVNSVTVKSPGRDRADIREKVGANSFYLHYKAVIGLYDSDGIRIAETAAYSAGTSNASGQMTIPYSKSLQILPQRRYFNTFPFREVKFKEVRLTDITDALSVRIDRVVFNHGNWDEPDAVPSRILSKDEWDVWAGN